jgi:hypothetical protein
MESSNKLDTLRTQGIQVNRVRRFRVDLGGQEVYDLMAFLQKQALAAENYLDCRQAVVFAEQIREQVTKQGF